MLRVPQAPPPGVYRNATPEATPGRWFDVNHIRFRGGQLQPIGGNVALLGSAVPNQPPVGDPTGDPVPDLPRDILTWHDNAYVRWGAFGTDQKLYVYRFDAQRLYDITPAGVGPLGTPGAFVGYGTGDYGEDTYGTARDPADIGAGDIAALMGDMWSMATFGQDLLVVPTQDGHLFRWSPPAGPPPPAPPDIISLPAVLVAPTGPSAAPIQNRGVIVTDQRHVVLLGAGGDPRNIAWSDQENPDVWDPQPTNLAGSKLLQTQSYVMTATKVSDGILIFTANDVHKMTYVGAPYAYGIVQIASGCGPMSLRSVVTVGNALIWPGLQNFWGYVGNVQPVNCDVQDWFFSLVNRQMVGRVFGSPNPAFSEFWWDWPDEGSNECNRYLAFNYADPGKPWTIGLRTRTAADPTGTMDKPVMGGFQRPKPPDLPDGGGSLFLHEWNWLDDGLPRAGAIYAESGAIVIGEGDRRYHCKQLVFDAAAPDNALAYRFFVREEPAGTEFDTGLYTEINDGLMDLRFSGRSIRMRMEALVDGPFAVGRPRLDIRPGGRR